MISRFRFAEKAKSLFNCGTRMEKALQRLAEANLTSKSEQTSHMQNSLIKTQDKAQQVNIAIVDTPSTTPSIQNSHIDKLFKGIPKALLEKVKSLYRHAFCNSYFLLYVFFKRVIILYKL